MTFQSIITRIENIRKQGNRRIMRNCGECGKLGHDRRTCPILLDKDIQNIQSDDTSIGINTEIIRYLESSISDRYRRLNRPISNGYSSNRSIKLKMLNSFDEGNYIDNNCNVCLEDINKNSMIMFQCGHGCCDKCASEIIRTTHKCHMCRDVVSELRICKEIPVDIFNNLNTILNF